jgi:AraC family transcriptional regulator of adaptative response/methylated-DNA-[protein]-cysteine methyltransferase
MDTPGPRRYARAMDIVAHARAVLDARAEERVTLRELARTVGASPYHLQRSFKRRLGLSPRDYQRERRLAAAKQMLAEGKRVGDSIFEAGYGSISRFYETAAERLGMRATEYRARGRGMRIGYDAFDSALGTVLVAASPRGVCALKLGERPEPLLELLREEFAQARLEPDPEGLAETRSRILAFLEGDASLASVPLDLRGTVFQRRVWEALRRIPRGETRSYTQIAREIGAPEAVRAVGGACGANPVALVVPCHRVLRADGSLGGYAWGLERKQRLLALEAAPAKKRRARRR